MGPNAVGCSLRAEPAAGAGPRNRKAITAQDANRGSNPRCNEPPGRTSGCGAAFCCLYWELPISHPVATYVVTGGAGFIGSSLVRALAQGGAHVRVMDNLLTGRAENLEEIRTRIEWDRSDIRDSASMSAAV